MFLRRPRTGWRQFRNVRGGAGRRKRSRGCDDADAGRECIGHRQTSGDGASPSCSAGAARRSRAVRSRRSEIRIGFAFGQLTQAAWTAENKRVCESGPRQDRNGSRPACARGDRVGLHPLCRNATHPPGVLVASKRPVLWKLPVYATVSNLLTNPVYAGAYAFGRTGSRTIIDNGRKRIVRGRRKDRSDWAVLLVDHHEGYLS
ncbi:recombinase family protein [Mesorhizobium sp.]|uniref:recombinase family protein n=1 Tax=Mesorhizobium sp. TaxID=1871066 RepID=UPI0025BBF678|nr:recombinase family protein [Mesorhizobium sp.]